MVESHPAAAPMKVLLTSVLATAVLSPRFSLGRHASHDVGEDTVVIELSSTVPGREVQFRYSDKSADPF